MNKTMLDRYITGNYGEDQFKTIGDRDIDYDITGTQYCHDCTQFYSGGSGQYCILKRFAGQYTKYCPEKSKRKLCADYI